MSQVWKKRTTVPDTSNKYYLKTTGGGYNKCILGNDSTNKEKNRQAKYSVLPNCVGYAYGRSLEIANKTSMEIPTSDAKRWYSLSSWQKTQTPTVGAVACWSGTYGHVAIVEEVYKDGTFLISESGWSSFYFRTRKLGANKYYADSLTFQGFLINPYSKNNYETVADEVKKTSSAANSFLPTKGYWAVGDKDDRVGKLCKFYHDTFPGYASVLKRNKKDLLGNVFGANAKAWTQEFQRRRNLKPTGKVDINTYNDLKKYGFKY